ncbi:uncharacterized protein LOC121547574 isoform X2 [Coregonus clupeaformis]|uniref:uncharacterized protein LOC121547574 isoform X2 n=1 Tax=Coregonus clupeaformis TaxID=59861 RepID=UPI001BE09EF5|nr:uncharacterized protein LOC121547574 isoform X2 [Coregonus clupeaformis]
MISSSSPGCHGSDRVRRDIVCTFWIRRQCRNGYTCRFLHGHRRDTRVSNKCNYDPFSSRSQPPSGMRYHGIPPGVPCSLEHPQRSSSVPILQQWILHPCPKLQMIRRVYYTDTDLSKNRADHSRSACSRLALSPVPSIENINDQIRHQHETYSRQHHSSPTYQLRPPRVTCYKWAGGPLCQACRIHEWLR